MQIECQRTPFIDPVNELLRELSRVGFFEQSLLVGSWPMIVYTQEFGLAYGLATDDIDFAVLNTVHRKAGAPGGLMALKSASGIPTWEFIER